MTAWTRESGPGTRRAGYTLVEVMFAMALFTAGALGITMLQIRGVRNNALSGSASKATALAHLHMERLMGADYDAPGILDVNMSNNTGLGAIKNADYHNVDLKGEAVYWGKFTLTRNVADESPVENTKTIVVIISWEDGRRKRQFTWIKPRTS